MEKHTTAAIEDENVLKHIHTVEAFPAAARANGGVLLDIEGAENSGLRLAKDGHTVLLPQPTDDPNDPLNWSSTKKHLILLTIAWAALCADFTSAAGTATIFLQAAQWETSIFTIEQPNSINVLMMGLGGLFWVPLTSIFGRAPVLFWTAVAGLVFSIAAAVAPTFEIFFAMRALTGFFITSGQTISIAFIKDMFFFHERARKIGLWACLYIASPYLGPCLANFVVAGTANSPAVYWMCVGVIGIELCLILAFVDETWYNREKHHNEHPDRPSGFAGRISRILGIWEIKNHRAYYESFAKSFGIYFYTLTKPTLVLVFVTYLLIFMWSIGINITTTILFATPALYGGYGYDNKGVGYLYFIPIVAVFIGEVFGHFFNDFLARRYVHKHKGVFEPEARLITVFVAGVFMIPGLILVGEALFKHLSVAAIIFGWGMYTFGIMLASVAITAYAVDSYPTAPAEVAGWINFARAMGGFSIGYFQQPWGAKVGYDASFGTQAAIVGVAMILAASSYRFGHRLRLSTGPVR